MDVEDIVARLGPLRRRSVAALPPGLHCGNFGRGERISWNLAKKSDDLAWATWIFDAVHERLQGLSGIQRPGCHQHGRRRLAIAGTRRWHRRIVQSARRSSCSLGALGLASPPEGQAPRLRTPRISITTSNSTKLYPPAGGRCVARYRRPCASVMAPSPALMPAIAALADRVPRAVGWACVTATSASTWGLSGRNLMVAIVPSPPTTWSSCVRMPNPMTPSLAETECEKDRGVFSGLRKEVALLHGHCLQVVSRIRDSHGDGRHRRRGLGLESQVRSIRCCPPTSSQLSAGGCGVGGTSGPFAGSGG